MIGAYHDSRKKASLSPGDKIENGIDVQQGISPTRTDVLTPSQQSESISVEASHFYVRTLDMTHLELLYHFIVFTAPAMSRVPLVLDIWRSKLPPIAFSHEFLMHSIFAVAALHAAHLDNSRQEHFQQQATIHADNALQKAHAQMAAPSASNADALFAFSVTTVYYAFAARECFNWSEQSKPLHRAVQSINLLRGIRNVGPSIIHWVAKGPLAPLLHFQPENFRVEPDFADTERKEYFSRLLLFCSTTCPADANDLEALECFAGAASSLRVTFLKVEAVTDDNLASPPIWHWAMGLSRTFVKGLEELAAVPLILIAHWCALLPRAKNYWWAHTWVEQTMKEIQDCIPEEHRHWLDWPHNQLEQASFP